MDEARLKKAKLEENLKGLGSVAVAFSYGVDSTFLLKTAHGLLGENAVAVTACSRLFPASELGAAAAYCEREGIRFAAVGPEELPLDGFRSNPPDRCYLCKRLMLEKIIDRARALGLACVIEGSNADDAPADRPGMAAVAELGVKSPLREAGLTKAEIRLLSREMGLPTWEKPSYACLASRIAYGEPITPEKLEMIEKAERYLTEAGFRTVRVRVHGDIARIETDPSQFGVLLGPGTAAAVQRELSALGFRYVTLDLGGYESGSMHRPPAAGTETKKRHL